MKRHDCCPSWLGGTVVFARGTHPFEIGYTLPWYTASMTLFWELTLECRVKQL